MFKFFDQVLGFFETLFSFFLNFIESLLMALAVIAESIIYTPVLVGLVPAVVGSAVTIGIAIYVVKFIIGR